MKSLAFFNNKGGVGKTTLACNAAAHFALNLELSVAVIDCDPQANATQLLLSNSAWEGLYENREKAERETVLHAMKQIRAGDSTVQTDVKLHESRRFGIKLLAGHPSLSTLEDQLSSSWIEFLGAKLGGARRSLWARGLAESLGVEVVIFDLGPSLGALNRSVLLGADHFVTPVAADLFSLYALENIGNWMGTWIEEYTDAYSRLARANRKGVSDYSIPGSVPIADGYVGYTVQQYVTRNTRGQGRGVAAYDRYRHQIPERAEDLLEMKAPTAGDINLGVVPNMFSMVPLAQNAHAPIAGLRPADGVRGAQVSQQARYSTQLSMIFDNLATNMGLI